MLILTFSVFSRRSVPVSSRAMDVVRRLRGRLGRVPAVRVLQGVLFLGLGPDGARAGRAHAQHLRAGLARPSLGHGWHGAGQRAGRPVARDERAGAGRAGASPEPPPRRLHARAGKAQS